MSLKPISSDSRTAIPSRKGMCRDTKGCVASACSSVVSSAALPSYCNSRNAIMASTVSKRLQGRNSGDPERFVSLSSTNSSRFVAARKIPMQVPCRAEGIRRLMR